LHNQENNLLNGYDVEMPLNHQISPNETTMNVYNLYLKMQKSKKTTQIVCTWM